MPTYKWEGFDKDGKKSGGSIMATNEKEVRKLLRAQGIRPKRINAPSFFEMDLGEWLIEKGLASSFGNKELMVFTKQLAIMVSAGVPIIQSLEILFKSEKNPVLKKTIRAVATEVAEGKTIAESMVKQKGFDRLYCNLVKAGEAGGILDVILNKLAEHLDKQEKIKAQIKSAMTYPVIVLSVGILVVWGLMVFVVPKFVEMLKDGGQAIPWITQMVMNVSNFFQEWTPLMIPSAIALVIFLNGWRKSPTGKPVFDNFIMKLPIFGGIIIKGNLASFARTISTMLGAGVPLLDALDICIETIDNGVIANDLKMVKKDISQGKTLTEPLMKIPYFPDMVAQMIKVGEQTGRVDDMFLKVSEVFEDEVNTLISTMTKMVEPLIIVFLGGMIAVVLVAMYLPIFLSAGGNNE